MAERRTSLYRVASKKTMSKRPGISGALYRFSVAAVTAAGGAVVSVVAGNVGVFTTVVVSPAIGAAPAIAAALLRSAATGWGGVSGQVGKLRPKAVGSGGWAAVQNSCDSLGCVGTSAASA